MQDSQNIGLSQQSQQKATRDGMMQFYNDSGLGMIMRELVKAPQHMTIGEFTRTIKTPLLREISKSPTDKALLQAVVK
jgi:hypothetical protein